MFCVEIQQCEQCAKCSGGCPTSFAMDYLPHQIVRLLQLERKVTVLESQALWLCTDCKICLSLCPHQINLPNIMKELKREARRSGTGKGQAYHDAFLASVERFGRTSAALALGIRNGSDIEIRWLLLKHGKIKVFRGRVHDKAALKRLFAQVRRRSLDV